MDQITYIIKGDPTALKRPRIGRDHIYDPQATLKLVLGLELQRQHGERRKYEGPLAFDIIFFMRIPTKSPKSIHKKYHMYRPDASNLLKLYEDVATGILYHDDCLIAQISATKIYDINPRVEFTITELRK